MSDRSSRPDSERGERPGLIERLRSIFGASHGSVRDDIEDAIEESASDDLSVHERAMLRNVLGLHELRVRDIMVPRADIVAIAATDTLDRVLSIFRTAGHSRLPVHGQTLDDPRGMVHIRDFVDYIAAHGHKPLDAGAGEHAASPGAEVVGGVLGPVDLSVTLAQAGILRPVLFVPPSMPALDLLAKMQASRTHMALVIDEYGGTDGLASIEDIVETIVGDIEDEHDEEAPPQIERNADGSWTVDARADVDEVAARAGVDVEKFADVEDIDTIGGLVAMLAGRVPARGEIITAGDGIEYEIIDADPRRVKRLKMRIRGAEPPADASAP